MDELEGIPLKATLASLSCGNPTGCIALDFPDSSKATGPHETQLSIYREVRNAIAKRIQEQFGLS